MKEVSILLFLSEYKSNNVKRETYRLEGTGMSFVGEQTNDAPMRYLVEQACRKGYAIKRIICITSYLVMTKPEVLTQWERFQIYVQSLLYEYQISDKPDFIPIPYDYRKSNSPEPEIEEYDYGTSLPKCIYEELNKCFERVSHDEEVFIEYSGGLRDINFLMTSIIRFLEFKGITCGEIVYSKKDFQGGENKLFDIHYIYDLYQLINGVNVFTNTGSAKELNKIFNKAEETFAFNLIRDLIAFSDALSICDVGGLDEKIETIIKDLEAIEAQTGDIYFEMLKTLAPIIREKMYLDEGWSYPKIIQWCAENDLIQQAATIYTEKMPKHYFDTNILPPAFVNQTDLDALPLKPGENKYTAGFYDKFYGYTADCSAEETPELDAFAAALKDLNIDLESMTCSDYCDAISAWQNAETDKNSSLYHAFERLKTFLRNFYKSNGTKKKNLNEIPRRAKRNIYKEIENGVRTNIKSFWEVLIEPNKKWLHYFLYNDEEDFMQTFKTLSTYEKKIKGVLNMKQGLVPETTSGDIERLYKIMAYYLSVKIMRNRINHAGEEERSDDELNAIETLNGLDIGINFEDNINAYRSILLKGIEL